MSCFEITEKDDSYFRTLVYRTMYKNFIVILRQKRNLDNFFETLEHTLLPIKFLPILNSLFPNVNNQTALLSNGYFCYEEPAEVKEINCADLPFGVKRVFFDYDCQVVTITNNQLGFFQALEEVGDFWGIQTSPDSPLLFDSQEVVAESQSTLTTPKTTEPRKLQQTTSTELTVMGPEPTAVVERAQTTPLTTKTGSDKCMAPKKRKLNFKL